MLTIFNYKNFVMLKISDKKKCTEQIISDSNLIYKTLVWIYQIIEKLFQWAIINCFLQHEWTPIRI